MKTNLARILAAIGSSFLLVGCCTQHNATAIQWEYKVVPIKGNANEAGPGYSAIQALLNENAKDGWVFVQESNGNFIFKRAMK
jgi:hypothetical protein